MIAHLPLTISNGKIVATMDKIQLQRSVPVINNYYSTSEFGAGTSWANDGLPQCTYFLLLAGALPFGCTGQLDEELRPSIFTAWVVFADPHKTKRQFIIQPVGRDFHTSLLRPPVAVWRGIGTELREDAPSAPSTTVRYRTVSLSGMTPSLNGAPLPAGPAPRRPSRPKPGTLHCAAPPSGALRYVICGTCGGEQRKAHANCGHTSRPS